MSTDLVSVLKKLLRDVTVFSETASGLQLRAYQVAVAKAVVESVTHRQGLSFVVMSPPCDG